MNIMSKELEQAKEFMLNETTIVEAIAEYGKQQYNQAIEEVHSHIGKQYIGQDSETCLKSILKLKKQ